MPENQFYHISREIANNYLRSVLFIDERAYINEDANHDHSFNAKTVANAFASAHKLCTIYAPNVVEDITNTCYALVEKADAIVLDWRLNLTDNDPQGNLEEDAPDDPRGEYTLQIIDHILTYTNGKRYAMVCVYTGEDDLRGVLDSIEARFPHQRFTRNENILGLCSKNVNIIVRSKKRILHQSDLLDFYWDENQLADRILDEFTKSIEGLLPNYALFALSKIRDNSSAIIDVFSREMDPAFLAHKVSIPNMDDANCMIAENFASLIGDLLEDSADEINNWESAWCDSHIDDQYTVNLDDGTTFEITRAQIQTILTLSEDDFAKRMKKALGQNVVNTNEHPHNENLVKQHTIDFLCFHADAQIVQNQFTQLIQQKNLLASLAISPILSLGTLIKENKENGEYYCCIQQSCDSQRIPTTGRDFLFLPIKEAKAPNQERPCIVIESKDMFVDLKSFNVKKIPFKPYPADNKRIMAHSNGQKLIFVDSSSNEYEWLGCLKYQFALRIVGQYVNQLSRVGIDQPEWVRLGELPVK